MFKVDVDVPLAAGARMQWPFQHMKPGESFAIAADPDLIQKCRMAAGSYRSRYEGMRFSVRKQADGSARCWRTA